MMTPGSPAKTPDHDVSTSSSGIGGGPLELPVFADKDALKAALHRDFDDVDGLPTADGSVVIGYTDDTTLPPPKSVTPWRPVHYLAMGLAILALAQAPLLWAFSEAKVAEIYTCADLGTPRQDEISLRELLGLIERCRQSETRSVEAFLRAPEEKIPEDAQIVDTSQPPAVAPEPVETKFVSDVTTRTAKETRAEVASKTRPTPGAGADVKQPAREAPPTATSPEPTTAKPDTRPPKPDQPPSDKQGEPDKAAGTEDPQVADIIENQKGDSGQVKPKSVMDRGQGGGGADILMPIGSRQNALDNIMAMQGGGSDHLPDVEPGDRTVLNSDSYRYADFFYAVKRAVERQWRPSDLYLRRDPTGQVYGVKDRYTVLRVELDRNGKVLSLVTSRPSGLDFMDEEARRAFRDAQPFVNPPLGLADADGKIRFEFGFYFEITGSKRSTKWRRL